MSAIPGIVLTGDVPINNPTILVVAFEKTGKCVRKSTLCVDPRTGRRSTIEEIVKQLKGDSRVLTRIDAGLMIETAPVRFFENPPEQLYKVRTQTGFEIEATASHPFMTQNGWKPLKDLQLTEDRVMTIAEYPQEIFWRGAHDDLNWIKILAYLIADGSLNGSCPVFTKNEDAVREDFIEAVEALGDSVSVFENNGVAHVRVRASNRRPNRTMEFIRDAGLDGSKAGDKFVPDFVFGLARKEMATFLSRLFTCDGSVERAGKISYSSKSTRLVQEVRHLLARFGIVCTIRDRYVEGALYGAELIVASRANVIRFIDEIGFVGEKQVRAEELRERLAKPSTGRGGDETQLWRHGPYLFDRIVSIEPTVIEPVYDIEIAGTHNFVANDFVIHNSSLACTLVDYPNQGDNPLVLAFDETGPESCNALGYRIPHIRIVDQPGLSYFEKTKGVLTHLENAIASRQFPYNSLVIDCGSTMTQRFFEEAEKNSKNPDQRAHYGDALRQSNHVLSRVRDLGLPNIWLAWLEPPHVQETKDERTQQKTRKFIMGRALIPGNFKANLAGRAQMILYLEKIKVGIGEQGADASGYRRVLHSKPYDNIEAGGRFNDVLPEPCPPHLGWIVNQIRNAPQIRVQARQAQQYQQATAQAQQQVTHG